MSEQIHEKEKLIRSLIRLEGKPYPAYKALKSGYQYHDYELWIDHVQGDPFATPSKVRVRMPIRISGFPEDTLSGKSRTIALCDFIARQFYRSINKYNTVKQGSGKSGIIEIDRPGQEVLMHTSVVLKNGFIEVKFLVGLPAYGRRIAGKMAANMFSEIIPQIIHHSLYFQQISAKELYRHLETVEDADFIRSNLNKHNLLAFVADLSVLPRASGIDPRPLRNNHVVPFESCKSLHVRFDLPNKGTIYGMGIPKGVTLIVGGGYHGKSTLLNSLEYGVYNHIPGDGREFVITSADAVKIRAEDGRSIQKLDISPFISNLPYEQDTAKFSTTNASGSTSQAANIMEFIEVGAQVLLMDEDTLATNFMIRDKRMRDLIAQDKEPIVPFIDHIRNLHEKNGVSTILVMGGCGDYFQFADTVIGMIEYRPHDLTSQAHKIAEMGGLSKEKRNVGIHNISRTPFPGSLNASKGKKPINIKTDGTALLFFGVHKIHVNAVEQLIHPSQLRAIAYAINYSKRYMDGERCIREICECVINDIEEKGLDCIYGHEPRGDIARFRKYELAATLNRFRDLAIK